MKYLLIISVMLLLSACASVSGETAHFKAQAGQQVALRDGSSFLTSNGSNSIVTVRPAAVVFDSRPEYFLGIENTSNQPLIFQLNGLTVTQVIDGQAHPLKVYSADELVDEAKSGEIGKQLLSGLLAGVADANSDQGDTSRGDAIIAEQQAASEENRRALRELTLHDESIAPGQRYAGKLVIETPKANDKGARVYAISVHVGPDQHEILVFHEKAQH